LALGGAGLGALHDRYGLSNLKDAIKDREIGVFKKILDPKMRQLARDYNNPLDLAGDMASKAKVPLALGGAGLIAKKKFEGDDDE